MSLKDVVTALQGLGYTLSRQAGSHLIFRHPKCSKPFILPYNSKYKTKGDKEFKRFIRNAERNIIAFPVMI